MADDDLVDDWKKEQPNDKRLAKTYFTSIVNPEDKQTYTYYSPVYTPIMCRASTTASPSSQASTVRT